MSNPSFVNPEFILYRVAKGGPGSGNFEHSGRPGSVGGSGPGGLHPLTWEKVKTQADVTRSKDHEFMTVYDKNGKVLQQWEGTRDEVGDPEWLAENSKDTVNLHNHPISEPGDEDYDPDYPDQANKPFSLQDLENFVHNGDKSDIVVSKDYDFILTRTGKPFTDDEAKHIAELMSKHLKTGKKDTPYRYPTHEDWEWLAHNTKKLSYTRHPTK